MSFRIVADSSANLYSLSEIDFAYVPLKVNCNGREFIDHEASDVSEMNQFLDSTKAPSSTSCPNIADWTEAFGDAEEIFAVTITSGLSGSYAAAESAAKQYMEDHPGRKVSVIDTLSAGPELTLIIEKIKECQKQGFSFEETDQTARAYLKKTQLLFSLCSLNNFAKNGRVSVAKAKIAGVLGIRVIGKASTEGTLQPLQNVRGENKSLSALFHLMLDQGYQGGKAIIAHCFNADAANALKEMICEKFKCACVVLQKTGILCSYYAEKGGLLVGYEA